MNRVSAVAAALTAAAAAVAAAATAAPALAASGPADHPATQVRSIGRAVTEADRAQLTAQRAAANPAKVIASETNGGKYVTVVRCSGAHTPPPIKFGAPGTPLTASGTGPSAGLLAMLSKPNPYKTVYKCTVTVETKISESATPQKRSARRSCELGTTSGSSSASAARMCAKKVTLNTGFGGMARQVAGHRPGH